MIRLKTRKRCNCNRISKDTWRWKATITDIRKRDTENHPKHVDSSKAGNKIKKNLKYTITIKITILHRRKNNNFHTEAFVTFEKDHRRM